MKTAPNRHSDHPIHPLILNRWSPRAMSGEPLQEEEIHSLFEAARWAPSCYNEQPWRFIYAKRDTQHWDRLYDLLVDFNKSWTHTGALLGVILSRKTYSRNNKPNPSFAMDAGSAWENLALEGSSRGLVVHGMGGFDYEKARIQLKIPEEYEVLAMFVVGRSAPKETLSSELQAKEGPSPRNKIEEFIYEGIFQK